MKKFDLFLYLILFVFSIFVISGHFANPPAPTIYFSAGGCCILAFGILIINYRKQPFSLSISEAFLGGFLAFSSIYGADSGSLNLEWIITSVSLGLFYLLTRRIIEQAMQCVQWYSSIWYIEELFRLLKTQGLDIEASQLEQGQSLKKFMLFSLQAELQLMIIKISYDNKDEKSQAKILFSDEQIKFLKIIQPTLEGKTEKQKNPFISESLVWAALIIAKLGKWSGYSTQSPPGYITMKNGMDIFHLKYDVFFFAFQAMRDVYKE